MYGKPADSDCSARMADAIREPGVEGARLTAVAVFGPVFRCPADHGLHGGTPGTRSRGHRISRAILSPWRTWLEGMPRLGAIEDLDRVVAAESPDTIVVAIAERHYHLPVDRLISLGDSGVHIEDAASTYETLFSRVSTRDLDPSQLMFTGELSPRRSGVFLRSAYSLFVGWAVAIVSLPLMALVAVLIKLSSPGPVLSREKRVGLNGAPFAMFRFRCDLHTTVGRLLHRLHLDALPEVFNVVKGDMSIIGPRPECPEFVAALEERIPYYGQRHSLRPGITGWAQINPQRDTVVQDALVDLEYDLYYMKNRAISLDTYILLQTIREHFFRAEA